MIFVRIIGALLIFLGAGMKMSTVWDIADIAQCILAFINIPVCIIIGGSAYAALRHYQAKRKETQTPVYKAAEVALPHKTDFWQK